jgi:hypothetical protein
MATGEDNGAEVGVSSWEGAGDDGCLSTINTEKLQNGTRVGEDSIGDRRDGSFLQSINDANGLVGIGGKALGERGRSSLGAEPKNFTFEDE